MVIVYCLGWYLLRKLVNGGLFFIRLWRKDIIFYIFFFINRKNIVIYLNIEVLLLVFIFYLNFEMVLLLI